MIVPVLYRFRSALFFRPYVARVIPCRVAPIMALSRTSARAFAEALFADGSDPPPTARMERLVDEVLDFVAQAGTRSELVLGLGLSLATWAAPPLVGKAPPLARLSLGDRIAALTKLEHSPAGLPLLAVKAIFCILYYEDVEVLREVGVIDQDAGGLGCLRSEVAHVE